MVYKLEKLRNTCVSQCARAPCVLVINFLFRIFSRREMGRGSGRGAGGEGTPPHEKVGDAVSYSSDTST